MAANVLSNTALLAAPAATLTRKTQVAKRSAKLSSSLFGKSLTVAPAPRQTCVKAQGIRAEAGKFQVISPLNGDPFIGGLETPVTSSPLIAWYLSNLPAYRTAVNPLLRGIEIGLAHGYLLVGPFALTGPLRNTEIHGVAGLLAAHGLVAILSICLTIYGIATFQEGAPSLAPSTTLTGRKKEADKLQTAEGWAGFSGGFFFGGLSGAAWAYILLYVLDLPYPVK